MHPRNNSIHAENPTGESRYELNCTFEAAHLDIGKGREHDSREGGDRAKHDSREGGGRAKQEARAEEARAEEARAEEARAEEARAEEAVAL